MGHLIVEVDNNSAAQLAGILPGWQLVSIDGQLVRDVIDYELFTSVESLSIGLVRPDGTAVDVHIDKESWEPLGLSFESGLMSPVRQCANHCVFCFIDQMPRGNRETLYFKDDDWRLSLIMGNYVTLTNVSEAEFRRIIDRRVAPLYISVHATDGDVRRNMMRNGSAGLIMERLRALRSAGLIFHSQIVLCPGLNDGDVLRRTLGDLYSLSPEARSVAIVPVGLTAHREGLYPLVPLSREDALSAIRLVDEFSAANEAYGFAFCSDEMYLRAGLELPPCKFYGSFDQIENGVGLFRLFEDGFVSALEEHSPVAPRIFDSVSGVAIADSICKLLHRLEPYGIQVNNHAVKNRFFGESVTVSGLVTARDIAEQTSGKLTGDALLIPSTMLRENGDVFLDGITVDELGRSIGRPVLPLPADDGEAFIERLFCICGVKQS